MLFVIVCAVIGIILFSAIHKEDKKRAARRAEQLRQQQEASRKAREEAQRREDEERRKRIEEEHERQMQAIQNLQFPEVPGYAIAYQYDEVEVAGRSHYMKGREWMPFGAEVTFRQEPNNQYDPNAVAIYYAGHRYGHVHANRLQTMVNDWIDRGLPVVGLVTIDYGDNALIKLAFYKRVKE